MIFLYEHFAEIYERLNVNADYAGRADYVLRLFEKIDKKPTLLLDLCCGTGSFTKEFHNKTQIFANIQSTDIWVFYFK